MRIGEIVKITEGPLVGLLARFAGKAAQRALIVVELQGRQLDVEMDLDWIASARSGRKTVSAVDGRGHRHWHSA